MTPVFYPRRGAVARALAAALVIAGSAALAGCSTVVDHIPTAIGGLPEGAPERPATPAAYPAVHDMPPNRGPTVFTDAEKKRLRDELAATRERTTRAAAPSTETIDIKPPTGAAGN
jgi:hypothetical protein